MRKVSIIIPVYNAEKYIEKCIESILNQTYSVSQIICVDDGSTDNSYKICEEYARRYPKIEVYQQENKGVSAARNNGLAHVSGDFVFFVDSDDYILPGYINSFMSVDIEYQYVAGGYIENNENGWKKQYTPYAISMEEFKKDCRENLTKIPTVHVTHCRYLYKIIKSNNIKFNENCGCGEDVRFNTVYFQYVDKIAVISECGYIYCLHENSAIHKFWPERCKEEYEECSEKERLFEKTESFNWIKFSHWNTALEHYYDHIKDNTYAAEARKKMKETIRFSYFRESIPYIMKYGTTDMKICALCLKIGSFNLYKLLIKIIFSIRGNMKK